MSEKKNSSVSPKLNNRKLNIELQDIDQTSCTLGIFKTFRLLPASENSIRYFCRCV